MAKAAVNMLTRTSARKMFETDGILMTSVDTGWISAARVYDPVVRGEAGEDVFGVFLKDYSVGGW